MKKARSFQIISSLHFDSKCIDFGKRLKMSYDLFFPKNHHTSSKEERVASLSIQYLLHTSSSSFFFIALQLFKKRSQIIFTNFRHFWSTKANQISFRVLTQLPAVPRLRV